MVMRAMRRNIGILKWMFVLLLLALLVGLVWDGRVGHGARGDAAALVDGVPVSSQAYSNAVNRRLEGARQLAGGELSELESKRARREALAELIDERLALAGAADLGQALDEEEFSQLVTRERGLADERGRFDMQRYQRLLQQLSQQEGLDWRGAEDLLMRRMLLQKVRGFFAAQAALTPREAREAEAFAGRQVKLQALVWNLDSLRAGEKISEEDLRSYYSENKPAWTKPEQLKLRQILVGEGGFAGLSAGAAARSKAEGLLAKLKAGADFQALAAEENSDPAARQARGDLGWLAASDLAQGELRAAARALKVGELSPLVRSSQGWHILKLEGRKPGYEPSYATARARAAKELGERRAARRAGSLAAQAQAGLEQGKRLPELAKALGGQLVESGFFGREQALALPALGASPELTRAALARRKGQALERPVFGARGLAVALLSDERPGPPLPKGERGEALAAEARAEALARKGEALYKAWLDSRRRKADIRDLAKALAD